MKVFYHPRLNIDLGLLNRLHPFDGMKFGRVREGLDETMGLTFMDIVAPVSQAMVNAFASPLLQLLLLKKRFILEALEVPYIPLVPFSVIDRRLLEPMRWGVGATLQAAQAALSGGHCWNLAGAYHHASRTDAQGFCIYNDIGIAVQELRQSGALAPGDRILIVDVDAHHGNGNARVFEEDPRVTLLDIYNGQTYPNSPFTKARVDINLPLRHGTAGAEYLDKLQEGLQRLETGYRLAFVVAGTDVLQSDPLGGLKLSIDDCVLRDRQVLDRLDVLSIPAVVLGGGGYGRDSATAIQRSIASNARRSQPAT